MTPAELREKCVAIYGPRGWQTRLSEDLKVDGSTVRRWVSGAIPVPGPVEAAVLCFAKSCPEYSPSCVVKIRHQKGE